MRKIAACFCLFLSLVSVGAFGADIDNQAGEPRATSLEIARVLDLDKPDEYLGYFFYERDLVASKAAGVNPWVYGRFYTDLKFRITYLEVEGEVIFDNPSSPKVGLPTDIVGGVVDFQIGLIGLKDGESVEYGSAYYPFLDPGEGIKITLSPQSVEQVFSFDSPVGVDPEHLGIFGPEGYSIGYYDAQEGVFHAWIDPMRGETPYWIIDWRTGDILSSGTLSPLGEPVVNQENYLSVDYVDDIKKVDLVDDSYQEFPDQEFTGRHEGDDGLIVPAKVFILERGEYDPTTMEISGLDGYVQAFVEGAEGLEILPIRNQTIPRGSSKVFVIFCSDENWEDGEFSVTFYSGGGGIG